MKNRIVFAAVLLMPIGSFAQSTGSSQYCENLGFKLDYAEIDLDYYTESRDLHVEWLEHIESSNTNPIERANDKIKRANDAAQDLFDRLQDCEEQS